MIKVKFSRLTMFLIIESHTRGQINHFVKRISSEQNQQQSNHRSQSEQRKILKELKVKTNKPAQGRETRVTK